MDQSMIYYNQIQQIDTITRYFQKEDTMLSNSIRIGDEEIKMLEGVKRVSSAEKLSGDSSVIRYCIEYCAVHTIDFGRVYKWFSDSNVKTTTKTIVSYTCDEKDFEVVARAVKSKLGLLRPRQSAIVRYAIRAAYYYLTESSEENKPLDKDNKDLPIPTHIPLDQVVFKTVYDTSNHGNKEQLLMVCREYLEGAGVELANKMREEMLVKIRAFSDQFDNIDKMLPPRKRIRGGNIIYISKAIAGYFLFLAEIEQFDIEELIEKTEEINRNFQKPIKSERERNLRKF